MAQKRMFDKRITDSDRFTDLPNSSKALYFMAGMSADDRGFFQPRRLQKMCGFTDDDFKVLIAKRYFIPFESGVMVITDWNKNNYLDKNRINETEYIDELNMLKVINEKYELNSSCLTDVKPMFNQYSIEENNIEENSIDKNKYIVEIIDHLNLRTCQNYKTTTKKTKELINARMKEGFTLDDFKVVIDKMCVEWMNTDMQKYLRPETLFGTKFESYLNREVKQTTKNITLSDEKIKELFG